MHCSHAVQLIRSSQNRAVHLSRMLWQCYDDSRIHHRLHIGRAWASYRVLAALTKYKQKSPAQNTHTLLYGSTLSTCVMKDMGRISAHGHPLNVVLAATLIRSPLVQALLQKLTARNESRCKWVLFAFKWNKM